MHTCVFDSWCETGHLHWPNKRSCTYHAHDNGAVTVTEIAVALHELHTRLAAFEELINGSAERGLCGAMTRLTLIEQLVPRTATVDNKQLRDVQEQGRQRL